MFIYRLYWDLSYSLKKTEVYLSFIKNLIDIQSKLALNEV